jgi:5-methylcytosine-specific restriction protein A
MKINKVTRPWHREYHARQKQPFYSSPEWRKLRQAFITSTSNLPDGRTLPNSICKQCYLEGRTEPVHTVDHIQRIRDGGDPLDWNNLQSLCRMHHDRKSSQEGHEELARRKRSK